MRNGPERLPHKVVELAKSMYAMETGFSGPELHGLFADYTDDLGPYTGWSGGGMSRWQIFESGLGCLTIDDQRRFLLDLCDYDGPSKYDLPGPESVAKLRGVVTGSVSPGAAAARERLAGLADWAAVQRNWDAALAKVASDPEGAITAARTTLESVCKHICDDRSVAYEAGWDLGKLHKAAASALEVSRSKSVV